MSEGKSFHVHTPATGKVQRPTVESLMAGTNNLKVLILTSKKISVHKLIH